MYTMQPINERTYSIIFQWITHVEDAQVFIDNTSSLDGQRLFVKWTTYLLEMDNTSSLNGQHVFFKWTTYVL